MDRDTDLGVNQEERVRIKNGNENENMSENKQAILDQTLHRSLRQQERRSKVVSEIDDNNDVERMDEAEQAVSEVSATPITSRRVGNENRRFGESLSAPGLSASQNESIGNLWRSPVLSARAADALTDLQSVNRRARAVELELKLCSENWT